MTRSFHDVLGNELPTAVPETPLNILDSLATALGKKSSRFDLKFTTSSMTSDDRAMHSLRAELRSLKYTLELLTISHLVTRLYPVKVHGLLVPATREVQDEEELFDVLAVAIKTPKAQELIATLLAQAQY